MFTKKKAEEINVEQLKADLTVLREQKPQELRFLLNEYANFVFDAMPWSELWADEEMRESGLAKFLPFLTPLLVIFMDIIVLIKK